MVVFVLLLCVQPLAAHQGVISEGGDLWTRLVAFRVGGGVMVNTGLSLLCAHGLIVLFRCVVVAGKVPAQLADVTVSPKQTLDEHL